jgi:predicted lipid-binding transport protein (Tim44 family)
MAHADIIIYGVIAVVLLARLWFVFGRRNEEDRQRPNPFATPAPGPADDNGAAIQRAQPRGNAPVPFAPILVAPMSLAGGLEQIRQIDASFDEKQFLQDAKGIFTNIVGAFARGDLSTVKDRLGAAVLPHFAAAINIRKKAGETLENKVIRIRETEVTAARAEGNRAVIAVRFVSEQENILCDASGNTVSGAPGKAEEITDLWTFARDAGDSKTGWQVIETKS